METETDSGSKDRQPAHSSRGQDQTEDGPARAPGSDRRVVLRNTLYLTVSQALTVPLSVITNVVMARYLGADAFGKVYLAGTICAVGFLVINWGQEAILPARVAQDHSSAGRYLGSSWVFRLLASIPTYGVMALGAHLWFPGDGELQFVMGLTTVHLLLTGLVAAVKDTLRGLERADVPAYAHVGQQVLTGALVIPVVMLSRSLPNAMIAQAVACGATLVVLLFTLGPTGVSNVTVRRDALTALLLGGGPVVVGNIVMHLQPMIDAAFLSRLTSIEVVGWYAVTRRLVGLLLFPAASLIGALYPTLCRLHGTQRDEFVRTVSASLRAIALLSSPIALGCLLYADVAISMFSKEQFGPAADNLRVISLFVFLVYFSMPLSTAVLASGYRRAWTLGQGICLVGSVALDPLLVPWFQERTGNGGLGLCVAAIVSELGVVAVGASLCPRAVFDARFVRALRGAGLGAVAATVVALSLRIIPDLLAAPFTFAAYGATLWYTGAIEPEHVAALRGFAARKTAWMRRRAM